MTYRTDSTVQQQQQQVKAKQEYLKIQKNSQDGVPGTIRSDASRLGTRGSSRDQVPTLSQRRVQDVRQIQAALRKSTRQVPPSNARASGCKGPSGAEGAQRVHREARGVLDHR